MCGSPKCLASARAMVPFPLAAGPSTAISSRGPGTVSVVGLVASSARFDRGMSLWQGARNVGGGPSLHRPILHLYNWS